jgi:hypothetical protein
MKRCPRCNQTFTDEWLTFCTQDGTSLVEAEASPAEPPPTLLQPPMPPSVSPAEQPTLDMPGRYSPPPAPYIPPTPQATGWNPPAPPPYPQSPQQSLAVSSLVLGIFSLTIGWCCSLGVITSPIAIVLGIVALVQAKNNPLRYGGKGFAIGGLVMGALYFAILLLIIIFYGLGILMSGMR